ncbi:hypothetical protein SAMN06265376_102562 [Dokdonia pacifica]|uniref:Uncharacterized protein n=1 Tax=Dokdonia pacifica TaxID=1627892 RepID=A0A238Z404_9FLAO|nr:hypothetical protein SAMN06265376_102562 [Dokdonia pacifica]
MFLCKVVTDILFLNQSINIESDFSNLAFAKTKPDTYESQ